MEKKITKKQKFEAIMQFVRGEETTIEMDADKVCEILEYEISLLDKKNAKKSGKETPTQKANRELQEKIIDFLMVDNSGKTATEIKAGVPELQGDGISLNKVVGLLRGITINPEKPETADYLLRKESVKNKMLFYVVTDEDEDEIEG